MEDRSVQWDIQFLRIRLSSQYYNTYHSNKNTALHKKTACFYKIMFSSIKFEDSIKAMTEFPKYKQCCNTFNVWEKPKTPIMKHMFSISKCTIVTSECNWVVIPEIHEYIFLRHQL